MVSAWRQPGANPAPARQCQGAARIALSREAFVLPLRSPSAWSHGWPGALAWSLSVVLALVCLAPLAPPAAALEPVALESAALESVALEPVALEPVALANGTKPAAGEARLARGAQLFESHCAGCHVGGGNIIRRGRTLKLQALQRNGLDSIAAIAEVAAAGRGQMSGYREALGGDGGAEAVAAWVWQQALQGWKPG